MFFRKKSKDEYLSEVNSYVLDCERKGIAPENYKDADFSKENFPDELKPLYTFAKKFGQSCDGLSTYLVYKSPNEDLVALINAFENNQNHWEEWLSDLTEPHQNEELGLYYLRDAYLHAKEHLEKLETYK